MNFSDYLGELQVLPVLSIESTDYVVDLCRALSNGGVKAVEITLRTAPALDAIKMVKAELPALKVAVGTITRAEQMAVVKQAGVDFAVSPGMTETLVKAAQDIDLPFLPGVSSASEVILGQELGLDCFKLFPATAVGGLPLLKSLAAPLADAKFCPTGGLTLQSFSDYLALPNVVCVGGTWLAPSQHVVNGDWAAIERVARDTFAKIN